jgi:dihydrofolate reductase
MELVVARNNLNYIGKNNDLLYHLKEDMNYFRELTNGNIIVMGKNTYNSLPNGPLSNRIHIVLTRIAKPIYQDNVYFTNLDNYEQVLNQCKEPQHKVFLIGGSEIYNLLWKSCRTLHITHIYDDKVGSISWDVPYELINKHYRYTVVKECISKNNLKYEIRKYEKRI